MVVEGQIHDVISAAKDNLVMPRVQMAVWTIMESSDRWPSSVVQNPDLRDFSASTEYIQLMAASSRTYLNVSYNLIVVTRNNETIEDGDSPALRWNFYRQTHTHHRFVIFLSSTSLCNSELWSPNLNVERIVIVLLVIGRILFRVL